MTTKVKIKETLGLMAISNFVMGTIIILFVGVISIMANQDLSMILYKMLPILLGLSFVQSVVFLVAMYVDQFIKKQGYYKDAIVTISGLIGFFTGMYIYIYMIVPAFKSFLKAVLL